MNYRIIKLNLFGAKKIKTIDDCETIIPLYNTQCNKFYILNDNNNPNTKNFNKSVLTYFVKEKFNESTTIDVIKNCKAISGIPEPGFSLAGIYEYNDMTIKNLFYYFCLVQNLEAIDYLYQKCNDYDIKFVLCLLFTMKSNPIEIVKHLEILGMDIYYNGYIFKYLLKRYQFDMFLELVNDKNILIGSNELCTKQNLFTKCSNSKKLYQEYYDLVTYLYENDLLNITDEEIFEISYHDSKLIQYFIMKNHNICRYSNFNEKILPLIIMNFDFSYFDIPEINEHLSHFIKLLYYIHNDNIEKIHDIIGCYNNEILNKFNELDYYLSRTFFTYDTKKESIILLINHLLRYNFEFSIISLDFIVGKNIYNYEYIINDYIIRNIKYISNKIKNIDYGVNSLVNHIINISNEIDNFENYINSYINNIHDVELFEKLYLSMDTINPIDLIWNCYNFNIFKFLFNQIPYNDRCQIFNELVSNIINNRNKIIVGSAMEYVEYVVVNTEYEYDFNTIKALIKLLELEKISHKIIEQSIIEYIEYGNLQQNQLDELLNVSHNNSKFFHLLKDYGANIYNSESLIDIYVIIHNKYHDIVDNEIISEMLYTKFINGNRLLRNHIYNESVIKTIMSYSGISRTQYIEKCMNLFWT